MMDMARDLVFSRHLLEDPQKRRLKTYYFESLKFRYEKPTTPELPSIVRQQLDPGQVGIATAYWYPFKDPEGSLYVDMALLNPDIPLVDNKLISIKNGDISRVAPNIPAMCDAQLAILALENRLFKTLGHSDKPSLARFAQHWPELPGDIVVANSSEIDWMPHTKIVSLEELWGLKK
jgi:hypothetical protein